MNKKFFPLLIFSITFPMLLQAKPVTVKGVVTNSSAYKYAYLLEFFGSELIKKDSSIITKNTFSFKKKDAYPRGFYQIKFVDEKAFNIILGNEDVLITADLNNFPNSLKISGSKENDAFGEYKSYLEKTNSAISALQTEASKAQQSSSQAEFQEKIRPIQAKYDSIIKKQQEFYKTFSTQNKDLYIGKFVSHLLVDSLVKKENYLSPTDFNDLELLRGDVLVSKINNYFQSFTEQTIPAWEAASKELISKTRGTKGQEVVFLSLLNIFNSADPDIASNIANEYAKTFPKSKKAKSIVASMPKASPKVGEIAPEIKLSDPSGKMVNLTSLRGKIVLIDFWASWCGPCRMENPNVVKVFNKYKDKGFMIYGVSLDSDKNKWLQAIEKDQLSWVHVSDLKNWNSEGAALYGVRSIPATYLIDKNGKIIAKNLRGEKLEEELKKILDSN